MRYALILFSQLSAMLSVAQNALHGDDFYTVKDGLSNNAVFALRQDSRGFLWVATKEGLNRFDGLQFKKFFFEKNNLSSLTHNNILDLLEYKEGQLLIGTGNGLSVLNTLTGKFENEKIKFPELRQGKYNSIQKVFKDNEGNIWVNHNGEIDLLDSNLNYRYRLTDLPWARSLRGSLGAYEDLQIDSRGRLWFLSDTSGLNIIDVAGKQVYNAKNNPDHLPYLQYPFIRSFLVDEENNIIWYCPWGDGLFKYDPATKKELQIRFGCNERSEQQTINAIVKTEEGNLLFGIQGKCLLLDPVTLDYHPVPMSAQSDVKAITPTTILKTKDRYWIGANTGLLSIDNKKNFKEIVLSTVNSRPIGECTSVCITSGGNIYSTFSNNALVVAGKTRDSFSVYRLPVNKENVFVCVTQDTKQRIWVGCSYGAWIFDEKQKVFYQPSFLPQELKKAVVNIIYSDADSTLWIGTRAPFALFHYFPANNQFEKINHPVVNRFASFGINSRISHITSDGADNLWMTSRLGGGIICFNKKDHTWSLYPRMGKNYTFLQTKGFTSTTSDPAAVLWLSNVFGDGLMRYNCNTDSLTTFTRSDGLLSNYIQHIYDDRKGRLWLTSEYGITAFDKKTLKADFNIVLNGIENDQSAAVDPSGKEMVIGLFDRLVSVYLENNSPGPLPVPVIDRITINNQQFFLNVLNPNLDLNADQKNIGIDFTAVNFSGKKIRFAYMLKGADKNWKFDDINQNAQYSILAPGHYTFMVKTGNDENQWSAEYTLFSFTIRPPWWKTWWFLSLCILIIAATIYIWIKNRERNIKSRAAERAGAEAIIQQTKMQLTAQQHKMAEAEMLALRAQMNPHFIFNSLNSINNYILKNDSDNAAGYLTKFSRLMRLILDNSRSNWVLFENELKALELYVELEAFRFDNSFTYKINLDNEVDVGHATVPPMIIQPYVENAIWHGLMHSKKPGAYLQIDIYRDHDDLCISIKDNGIGRQAAGKLKSRAADGQKSHGMKITAERLEIMNKVYGINAKVTVNDISDDNATGTEVLIKFKYTYHNEPANV